MPLLLKASIKRTYAENLLNDISLNRGQYFLFVAKSTPWEATAGVSADIVPVTPPDTVEDEYGVMRSVIGYKKLDPSKIVFALDRVPWEIGTYDAYEDDESLFDEDSPKNFFVVTSANNVYKCLKAGSGNSIVEPTHTSTEALEYSDGYTWKYLATVKESLLPYELTDYIPITYAISEQDSIGSPSDSETTLQFNAQKAAVNGQITRIDIVDTGITSGGASAAVYLGSEYGARFAVGVTGSTTATASFGVGDYFTVTSSTNTNAFSLPVSDISNYIGYVLRVVGVSGSGTNPSDVNNYGIIHGVTASSNEYTFTVRGEHTPFLFSLSGGGQVYYDIIPYVRISGDGNGAYAFAQTGLSGTAEWRNITAVDVIDGGEDYSQAAVEVVSPKADGTSGNTVHPTFKAVLPPKGGHGVNILKELNVKDVVMIATVDENDNAIIQTGGSYRKFGIIKDPVLNDGSGIIAGSNLPYYRDLILLYTGNSYSSLSGFQNAYFDGSANNFIIGRESYALFPVAQATSYSDLVSNEKRVQVKVRGTGLNPISWIDRLENYDLSLTTAKTGFLVGEKLTQNIPAGVSIAALGGITYAFGISAEGTIISATSSVLGVRVTRNAFVRGTSSSLNVTGQDSGVTASLAGVSLSYGEEVFVNRGFSFASEAGLTRPFFKIISAGVPYYESASVPSYTGLTVLRMSKVTGMSDFTSTTWQNGDRVEQGVSGSYLYDYASGTVYSWSRTDASNGLLYVTEPFGIFKSVANGNGLTASRLNDSGGINTGYRVAGVSAPGIDIHSGEIIYINSIKPIQRLPNQSEEFRLRVGF